MDKMLGVNLAKLMVARFCCGLDPVEANRKLFSLRMTLTEMALGLPQRLVTGNSLLLKAMNCPLIAFTVRNWSTSAGSGLLAFLSMYQ